VANHYQERLTKHRHSMNVLLSLNKILGW